MSDSERQSGLEQQIDAALDSLREGLKTDGCELQIVRLEGSKVDLAVRALPEACEECLVPEELMKRMIVSALPAHLRSMEVGLEYPPSAE